MLQNHAHIFIYNSIIHDLFAIQSTFLTFDSDGQFVLENVLIYSIIGLQNILFDLTDSANINYISNSNITNISSYDQNQLN